MDQDQLQAWKHNKVTKEILSRLEQKIESSKEPHLILKSVEETALRNARASGYLEGLREPFDIIAEMEEV